MIVDVHSHYFRYPEHFTEDFKQQSLRSRNGVEVDMTVRWEDYHPTALTCDKTIAHCIGDAIAPGAERAPRFLEHVKIRAAFPTPLSREFAKENPFHMGLLQVGRRMGRGGVTAR